MKAFSIFPTLWSVLALQAVFSHAERLLLLVGTHLEPPAFEVLRDRPSFNEKLQKWTPELQRKTLAEAPSTEEMCSDAETEKLALKDAIQRAVNFYEAHVSELNTLDAAVGLQVVQGISQHLEDRGLTHLLSALITDIVKKAIAAMSNPVDREGAITAMNATYSPFSGQNFPGWSPHEIIAQQSAAFPSVGDDPEIVWGRLNSACFVSLMNSCEVPTLCRNTYLDPEPQSQYMLTHQVLYRLMARSLSCDIKHRKLFIENEENLELLCAKMYAEAEMLAEYGFPVWGRDLFSEYVFISGLAGFPNLLRTDWTQEIASWQSKSEFGCFVNPDFERYFSTEVEIQREQTSTYEETSETCLTHFTSTSLSALAIKLGWLSDNC
ncbi:UPF0764 protein C16orf89 [Folsomia candida]|uniref:Uncharacterized protein n=1 Tax=Folsomia candida TaxID=158441 RepID=A0A226EX38_FOLCA|nr:UPF0764 protein C16orf89 [Folsomia candida]XP_021967983.1 UPF0764 protein C16orf89 [Folsomia candida]OXA62173.1 hypothetical protein Fcan01_00799 [Folsomia candida]